MVVKLNKKEGDGDLNYLDSYNDPLLMGMGGQNYGYQPTPKRFDSEFLKLYDVEDILIQIENFLRGKVRDENGIYVQAYTKLASDEGINLLMGDLRCHLHKIVFLSNLSKEDVLRMSLDMRRMVVRWIYLNWYVYEIDKSNMDRIVYNIDHMIFTSLMKPLNDKERQHLGETTTRTENVMVNQQDRQKRWGIL